MTFITRQSTATDIDICAICTNSVIEDESLAVHKGKIHFLHSECFKNFLQFTLMTKKEPHCPICKERVTSLDKPSLDTICPSQETVRTRHKFLLGVMRGHFKSIGKPSLVSLERMLTNNLSETSYIAQTPIGRLLATCRVDLISSELTNFSHRFSIKQLPEEFS